MSEAEYFNVTVAGIDYEVEATTRNTHDTFRIALKSGEVITEQFGVCNPLRDLWDGWRWYHVHGAARRAMEEKCIRDAVRYELSQRIVED